MRDQVETTHVGDDWEIKLSIEDMKDRSREGREKRRYQVAMYVMTGIAIGAFSLAIYGVYMGNFGAVSGFWGATGPIFGAIIGYYFGKNGDDP